MRTAFDRIALIEENTGRGRIARGKPPFPDSASCVQKILREDPNYDKMNFSTKKGVILCQVTPNGIPSSIKRPLRIRSAAGYLRA
jgi:hypothetical protein